MFVMVGCVWAERRVGMGRGEGETGQSLKVMLTTRRLMCAFISHFDFESMIMSLYAAVSRKRNKQIGK